MKQPALGLVASAIIIALALAYVSLFSFETFVGWASYALMVLIPAEIVVGVAWGANPAFAAKLPQPIKGIVLVAVCVLAAAIIGPIYWQTVGGGLPQPAPMLIMCVITSVVITFWLAIMFGGWPFNVMTKNQVASGILLWIGAYAINYGLFRVFFNYSFMAAAPVYNAALDPGGIFNASNATVFYVTAVAILFVLLHFDLWPLTLSPSIMKQPNLGIVWTLLALVLGGAAYYIGVDILGMDPMLFLVRVPVPFIFGTIIVLNMLHNSTFASLQQPVKGIANTAAAAVIGTALALLYGAIAPTITGALNIGLPTNDFERWLASALLGVTFPFLIFYAEFFKMWPLMPAAKPQQAEPPPLPRNKLSKVE
ncbi:MAG: hypothetical protein WDO18_01065 [Acidobacteriota bacterium]